jgi:predicted nucleic acid-binding protein
VTSERLVVIADAGPIIALSIVGQLDLLGVLFGTVLVPEAVYGEVVVQGKGRPGAIELARASWIERVTVSPPPDALLAEELGPGEAEAIALGVRRSADVLLIDERKGRRIATLAYHLRVKGTAGVLVLGKQRGLVPSVRPLLEAMRAGGYYVAESLIDLAARQVGE